MTVCLLPDLPPDVAAQLEQLLASKSDSLQIGKVLQDAYIQLNFQASKVPMVVDQQRAVVSGSFVLSEGRFYIVQGREQTDASLDKREKASGRKIPADLRTQYKQKGGALQLEGKSIILGAITSGEAVLDRIAALPSDATGRPLRPVPMTLERKK